MSKLKLKCELQGCNNTFERSISEINRSKRLGRPLFCSRSCGVKHGNQVNPRKGNPKSLRGHNRNRIDENSVFRWFARIMKKRAIDRKKEYNITVDYIRNVWEKQKGICPYTGWQLILPLGIIGWKDKENNIYRASLDRIDSSKGYIEGNIQFVSIMANYAKNNFTDKDLLEFCRAVVSKKVLDEEY